MLQQDIPEDFVIATGVQYSVREFIQWSGRELGLTIDFSGKGVEEIGTISSIKGDLAPAISVGDVVVRVDPRYFRPTEVDLLIGDPSKAKKVLDWEAKIGLEELVREMVSVALQNARLPDSAKKLAEF